MDVFIMFMDSILMFFKIPIVVYGFSFSFWDVFLFTCVAFMVFGFVGALFRG